MFVARARTTVERRRRGAHRAEDPRGHRALRWLAAVGVVALTAGGGAISAQAAPGDTSYAEGQFLSGTLLDFVDLSAVAGIDGETASSDGVTPETNSTNLDLSALSVLSIDIGGGVQVPLNFTEAGVVGQYASAAIDGSSIGASGLISDSGAIGTGVTPAPGVAPGPMSLDLAQLLGPEFATTISDLDVTLGAISANAAANTGGAPVGDYEIASATVVVDSPVVEGITGTVDAAVADLDAEVDALAGPDGLLVEGVLSAVSSVLAVGGLGDASATVTVDLQAAVDAVLDMPLDSGGGVVIDLQNGTITLDLDQLVGGLNDLDPSTELLSSAVLTEVTSQVAELVDGLVADLDLAVTNALNNAAVSIDVDINGPAPLSLPLVNVTVTGTLLQISDGTATVGITALGGLPIGGLTDEIILDTLGPIVDAVIDPDTGALGTFLTTLTDDVLNPVINELNPALLLLNTVVSLLANVQEPSPGVAGQVFEETALRLSLLPTTIVPELLELNLARALVGPNLVAPVLTTLTPDEGPTAGGTLVTIDGTALGGATAVTVDGVSVPFTQVSETQITFSTPPHAEGPVGVTVTTAAGVSAPLTFTYVPAPVLTTLTPDEGPAAGGTPVTIDGTDLAGATEVSVDGVSVPFTQVSDTQITFSTPAHAAGPVDVTVTTAGGESGPLTFTYIPAPVLTDLDPEAGPVAGGTPVTITGTDLGDASEVTVDGVSVPFTQVSGTQITFSTPAHAAGPVDVVVTTPGGDSNALPFTYFDEPVLTTLTPDEGPAAGGTPVTIDGTALGGATAVTVDGVSVPFTQVGPTEITFTTPAHAAGPVDVVVTTPGGDSNALPFTYYAVPAITGLDPDAGPVAGGTPVTITGTDLGGATAVTVDGVSVPFTQVSPTEITFETPAHTAGPVDVVVTTPGGESNALPFTYYDVPTLTALSPEEGPTAGGTLVTVTGTNLAGATELTVDGVSVPFTQVDDTTVAFQTPSHAAGPVDVVVTTPGGESNALPFTYVPAPVLTDLDPDAGPVAGGTPVTITGTDLGGATAVTVDGVSVPFTQVSPTEITFETPAHAAGEVNVVVVTAGGPSNALPFTYYAVPSLTSLTPEQGPTAGGTSVTVTGTALGGATELTVDGVSVPFTQVSDTEITFETPAHAAGPVDVVVTTPGGASGPLAFTYVPAPLLTGLDPDAGPVAGGTPVTITGTDLGGATEVTVDGVPVPFTQVGPTEITFTTPAHAAGPVDVVVTTPGGDSNALPFTYYAVPSLASLTPDEGPTAGGTLVTIDGTALGGATEVSVDGVAVPFIQVSPTQITFSSPPHAAGPVDVVVTTPGGASDPLTFTYIPAPVLTALAPDQGPVAGGTPVTITGTDLGDASEVTVDGVSVPFTQVSDTEITFETPAHAAGEVDVVVTTAGGDSNALPFTYFDEPVLTTLTPDEGPAAGGTLVTITGSALGGATEVTVDGVSVPFTQVSDTQITFTTAPHAAGPVDVVVTTPGGASDPLVFTYLPGPVITALDPDAGPIAGGTPVTITGTDLGGATEVTVDGVSVPFTQVSPTEIEFETPAHAAGEVDVVVVTGGGESNALPFTYYAVPTLAALDPDEGPTVGGTIVTVTGTNLAGATELTVDGVAVAFTPVSDTTIVFTTPPHAAGEVDVVVTTPGGESDPLTYTYVPAPVLAALDPDAGPVAGGTPVTITGTDLGGATEVTVDGVSVPFTQVGPTEIDFVTPAHLAGEVDVVVTTPGGESNALPFTYVAAPVLTALAPDAGPVAGGTPVTITGTDLGDAAEVTVDGVSVPFTQVSDTEITFETPAHAAGPVDVVVTTPGGASGPLAFTYVPAPLLTGLDPDAGPVAGGTPVTITGTDLGGATAVTVDGVSVPFTQVSPTEITFETPAHTAGPVDVVVTTPGGESNALPFTYYDVPTLTALSPEEGPTAGGTLVTVTGTNLAGATELTVDGVSVPFTQVDDTTVAFQTPSHAAGPVDVVVTTPGGESNALPFTYVPAPVLTDLDPDAGPVAGGTPVTITGTDLGGATAVTVDGVSVPFTQVSPTEITFETPAHAAGEVNVVVVTAGGPSNALPFTYYAVPSLTSLTPEQGPTAGGTLVTITGTDLGDASEVTVDGLPVPFTQVSDTEITFETPAHTAGEVDVVVTTPGSESNALAFTYVPTVIDDVDPPNGPEAGGTEVTISGQCFTDATEVLFGDAPATSFEVIDDGTIVAVAPAGTGVVDVTVVGTEECGEASLPAGFTYESSPAPTPGTKPGAIASTGVDLIGPLVLGGGVLLLGLGMLFVVRRRSGRA
ncbi:IPT/TIG domain-containing protein [Agromyces sp. NPDC055658]